MASPENIIAINRLLAIAAQLQTTRLGHHLDKFGLTVAQFSVIVHLSRQKAPVSISRVAQAVEVLQPAVTKMVRKFEAAGWVTILPDPSDQRSRLIALTPEGGALIQQVYGHIAPEARACFGDWSEDDLAAFGGYLGRVVGWLDANRLP